jgi:hypothetical protein
MDPASIMGLAAGGAKILGAIFGSIFGSGKSDEETQYDATRLQYGKTADSYMNSTYDPNSFRNLFQSTIMKNLGDPGQLSQMFANMGQYQDRQTGLKMRSQLLNSDAQQAGYGRQERQQNNAGVTSMFSDVFTNLIPAVFPESYKSYTESLKPKG